MPAIKVNFKGNAYRNGCGGEELRKSESVIVQIYCIHSHTGANTVLGHIPAEITGAPKYYKD